MFLVAVLGLIVVAAYSSRVPEDTASVTLEYGANRNSPDETQISSTTDATVETESASSESTDTRAPGRITLPDSFTLPVSFGDLGLRLQAAGAIDYDSFVNVYERAGQALNEAQLAILSHGSDSPIVFNQENAYFLLNFLWALGLTNQNPILDEISAASPPLADGQLGNVHPPSSIPAHP
jgi:hypothetical protein